MPGADLKEEAVGEEVVGAETGAQEGHFWARASGGCRKAVTAAAAGRGDTASGGGRRATVGASFSS